MAWTIWTLTLVHLQTLSAKAAAALDRELMSTGAFSIDQLMELAGLSVSQAGKSRAKCSVWVRAGVFVCASVLCDRAYRRTPSPKSASMSCIFLNLHTIH